MYTSDINVNKIKAAKTALVYLVISVFCAVFGAIYELYSHEVYSFYMIYAFAFPLVGGTLPFLLLGILNVKYYPCTISCSLYHCGIATLTVGSIIRGFVEIYGTTNRLIRIYRIIGGLLIAVGIVISLIKISSDAHS